MFARLFRKLNIWILMTMIFIFTYQPIPGLILFRVHPAKLLSRCLHTTEATNVTLYSYIIIRYRIFLSISEISNVPPVTKAMPFFIPLLSHTAHTVAVFWLTLFINALQNSSKTYSSYVNSMTLRKERSTVSGNGC